MRRYLFLGSLLATLAGCSETASGTDSGTGAPDATEGADSGDAEDAASTPPDGAPDDDAGAMADAQPAVDAAVVGEAPVAEIWHPSAGEMRDVDVAIPMIGNATDAEDGDLGGDAMIWSSDLEGEVGRGRMFDWTPTMVGEQTVTLTATDRDGNADSASITLTIE